MKPIPFAFLTPLIPVWGESPQRNGLSNAGEAFDAESSELELLKLKREALRDDPISWGERVDAWVKPNRKPFDAQAAILLPAQIPSRPDDAVDPSQINDLSERAIISACQEPDRALRRDLPPELAGDDGKAWLENWSEQSGAPIEKAEETAEVHTAEERRNVKHVIIELPDNAPRIWALADAEGA